MAPLHVGVLPTAIAGEGKVVTVAMAVTEQPAAVRQVAEMSWVPATEADTGLTGPVTPVDQTTVPLPQPVAVREVKLPWQIDVLPGWISSVGGDTTVTKRCAVSGTFGWHPLTSVRLYPRNSCPGDVGV